MDVPLSNCFPFRPGDVSKEERCLAYIETFKAIKKYGNMSQYKVKDSVKISKIEDCTLQKILFLVEYEDLFLIHILKLSKQRARSENKEWASHRDRCGVGATPRTNNFLAF